MSSQQIQKYDRSSISKYLSVIILAILPVALALYATGAQITEIPKTLFGSVFPVALTILSWGFAIQQLIHIKKKS